MKPKLVNQNNFGGRKGFYLKSTDHNQGGPSPSVMWIKAEPQKMFQIEFKIMFWVISACSVQDCQRFKIMVNRSRMGFLILQSRFDQTAHWYTDRAHSSDVALLYLLSKLIIIEPN